MNRTVSSFIRASNRWLLLILAISTLARVAAALYLGDTVEILPGTYDQLSYDALARNVAAGKGFVFDRSWYPFTPPNTPTAHWSFLYVLYLAGVYALFGFHPLVARLIQAAIVGIVMPWLIYRLGKRTFSYKVGLFAAAGVSVYIYLVYYSGTLMTEPFYIVALLWALDALQRLVQRVRERGSTRAREWTELGLAWGLAALLRQQMLLLVPVFLAWLLWASWGHIRIRKLGPYIGLSMLIIVAFILPWTVRNYLVYGDFLPLNSNVGWALYAANHPQQGNRFEPLNLPPLPLEWQGLNEAELNSKLTAAGIRFVLEDPGRFLLQSLDRFRNYFRFWPEAESSPIANVSRVLSFGFYLPFMLYGLFLSLRSRAYGRSLEPTATDDGLRPTSPESAIVRHGSRFTVHLVLLYLYVLTYSTIHLLSWAMHRYRLPVDAVMMVFVGLASVDLYGRFVRWRASRTAPVGS